MDEFYEEYGDYEDTVKHLLCDVSRWATGVSLTLGQYYFKCLVGEINIEKIKNFVKSWKSFVEKWSWEEEVGNFSVPEYFESSTMDHRGSSACQRWAGQALLTYRPSFTIQNTLLIIILIQYKANESLL